MTNVLAAAISRRQQWLPPDRDGGPGDGTIVSSTAWSSLGIGAGTLLRIVRSMIFARLLMPEDFGILGLANVMTQFILVFTAYLLILGITGAFDTPRRRESPVCQHLALSQGNLLTVLRVLRSSTAAKWTL